MRLYCTSNTLEARALAARNVRITICAMNLPELFRDLPTLRLIEHYPALGSTNDRAREVAQQDAPELALIVADEQLAGRGRQTRSWYTPPGTALAFSLLVRPAIAAQHAMRLTMLAGLAAVEGIEHATGLRLDLKWPNDVVTMINDQLAMNHEPPATNNQPPTTSDQRPATNNQRTITQKIGGILTECAFQGDRIEYAVIGIGLNINVDFASQPELRDSALSLKQLLQHEVDRWLVLKAVVAAFADRYAEIADADRLREAWASRLINLQRRLQVKLDDRVVEGLATGVDQDGALLLRTDDGRTQRLLAGDVTLHDLNR